METVVKRTRVRPFSKNERWRHSDFMIPSEIAWKIRGNHTDLSFFINKLYKMLCSEINLKSRVSCMFCALCGAQRRSLQKSVLELSHSRIKGLVAAERSGRSLLSKDAAAVLSSASKPLSVCSVCNLQGKFTASYSMCQGALFPLTVAFLDSSSFA